MAVLLVGVCSEGSVWLVWEVRRVLGVGSKTKNWVDCNSAAVRANTLRRISKPKRSNSRTITPRRKTRSSKDWSTNSMRFRFTIRNMPWYTRDVPPVFLTTCKASPSQEVFRLTPPPPTRIKHRHLHHCRCGARQPPHPSRLQLHQPQTSALPHPSFVSAHAPSYASFAALRATDFAHAPP